MSSSPPKTVGGAMTMVAPVPVARSSSKTEASKLGEATARVRESGVMVNRSRCSAARLASPWWVTATPLGVPVEPEV